VALGTVRRTVTFEARLCTRLRDHAEVLRNPRLARITLGMVTAVAELRAARGVGSTLRVTVGADLGLRCPDFAVTLLEPIRVRHHEAVAIDAELALDMAHAAVVGLFLLEFSMAARVTALGVEPGLHVVCRFQLETCRMAFRARAGRLGVGLKPVASEAGVHQHEVLMLGVARQLELKVLGVRDAVVAHRARYVVLGVHRVIDDDSHARRDRPIVAVALRALRGLHLLGELGFSIQRKFELVRDREVQLTERLRLVQHERNRIGVDRHVTCHTGYLAMRRCVVCGDGVVLDLVAPVRTEPVGRGHTERDDNDRGEHKHSGSRPDDGSGTTRGITIGIERDSGHGDPYLTSSRSLRLGCLWRDDR